MVKLDIMQFDQLIGWVLISVSSTHCRQTALIRPVDPNDPNCTTNWFSPVQLVQFWVRFWISWNRSAAMSWYSTTTTTTTVAPPMERFCHLKDADELTVVVVPLYIIISILTILGNGLVIGSVLLFKNLRTPTNNFVVALAFADFMVMVNGHSTDSSTGLLHWTVIFIMEMSSGAGGTDDSVLHLLLLRCAVHVRPSGVWDALLYVHVGHHFVADAAHRCRRRPLRLHHTPAPVPPSGIFIHFSTYYSFIIYLSFNLADDKSLSSLHQL